MSKLNFYGMRALQNYFCKEVQRLIKFKYRNNLLVMRILK